MLTAGSMVVRRDRRLRLEGTNLVISDLEPEDSGEYDCEIEADSDRPISVTHRLDILIPPTVSCLDKTCREEKPTFIVVICFRFTVSLRMEM